MHILCQQNWKRTDINNLFPKCIKSLRKLNFKFTVQTKILTDISHHLHCKQSSKIFFINFCDVYARFMQAILLSISQVVLCQLDIMVKLFLS